MMILENEITSLTLEYQQTLTLFLETDAFRGLEAKFRFQTKTKTTENNLL